MKNSRVRIINEDKNDFHITMVENGHSNDICDSNNLYKIEDENDVTDNFTEESSDIKELYYGKFPNCFRRYTISKSDSPDNIVSNNGNMRNGLYAKITVNHLTEINHEASDHLETDCNLEVGKKCFNFNTDKKK